MGWGGGGFWKEVKEYFFSRCKIYYCSSYEKLIVNISFGKIKTKNVTSVFSGKKIILSGTKINDGTLDKNLLTINHLVKKYRK